jgi:hypothetical protein
MEHKEVVRNPEIESVLTAFKNAVECVPRGICTPDDAHVVVSKYYVAFLYGDGELKLIRDGKSLFAEVRASGCRLLTGSDMFVFKNSRQTAYSPRIAVGGKTLTTDEFVEFVRKGFQVLLSAANWV